MMSDIELKNAPDPLQIHIRQLLLNYAMTHLTTDYTEFTEKAVSEVRLAPVVVI